MLTTAASWVPVPTVVLILGCVLPHWRYLLLLAGLLAALRTSTGQARVEMFTRFTEVFTHQAHRRAARGRRRR